LSQGRLLLQIQRRARRYRIRRWLVTSGGVFVLYLLVGGRYGFIRYQRLKAREHDLVMEQRKLTADAADLVRQIDRLRYDTLYIEQIARERYGFARPHERVYKITPY